MKGNYVEDFDFAPNQTAELENKVMALHQTHRYIYNYSFSYFVLSHKLYINIYTLHILYSNIEIYINLIKQLVITSIYLWGFL